MNADPADNASTPMRATTEKRARRRLGSERGQAMVEFAIIAPLFVALVAGVIQFGVALNYWLDLQRLANQGARWAVVNRYPDETQNPAITCTAPPSPCTKSLTQVLEQTKISSGNGPTATVCYVTKTGPGGNEATAGDPVRVRLTTDFQFVPIIKVGSIQLTGTATMRLEQKPTNPGLPAPSSAVCPP